MNFDDMQRRAVEISDKYDALNMQKRGIKWDEMQQMAGFVADIGELSEIIMAKHGLRSMDNVDERLAHELSDCLWSIIVLANKYGIDLAREFMEAMDKLDRRIDKDLSAE